MNINEFDESGCAWAEWTVTNISRVGRMDIYNYYVDALSIVIVLLLLIVLLSFYVQNYYRDILLLRHSQIIAIILLLYSDIII